MNEENKPADVPESEVKNQVPPKKKILGGFLAPVIIIACTAALLLWLNFAFGAALGLDLYGPAIKNIMIQSVFLLGCILLTVWFAFFSPFQKSTVRKGLVFGVLALGAFFASIKQIEPDGDMWVNLHFRWQGNENERLLEEQKKELETNVQLSVEESFRPEDMPAYRGGNRDGIVIGPILREDWKQKPLVENWRQPIGGGYAQFAVQGDLLVTIEQRKENEAITCYSAETGKLKWIYEYSANFFEAMGGEGPRTTPTIHDGKVFSVGAEGNVVCLDLSSGEKIWSKNMLKENDVPNVIWGMSSSPLIVDDMVVVNPGGPKGNGMIAYNIETGDTVWTGKGVSEFQADPPLTPENENRCGYSSPMLAEIAGVRQIILLDGQGLSGYQIFDGKQLWHYEFNNGPDVNVAQPIVLKDDQIFICASYGIGSVLLKVNFQDDQWAVKESWKNIRIMRCKFTSPVLYEDHVYGLDEGIMMCIDPYTGKKKWKKGRFGNGQILITGDQILIMGEKGDLAIVKANPEKYQEVARTKVLTKSVKVWNPHALVDGQVFVRDHVEMASFDLADYTSQ